MKINYDYLVVGERLRTQRTLHKMTQDDIAEKIGRVPKYYADIERGSCGMSIETMLSLSVELNMSLDYMMFGKEESEISNDRELLKMMNMIQDISPQKRKNIIKIVNMILNDFTE